MERFSDSFSFSLFHNQIIYKSLTLRRHIEKQVNDLKRGFILFVLVVFFLSSFVLVTSVSATNACCERDTSGNWCQYTDESNCDSSYLSASASCGETSFCQVGCCYSSADGSCYKNTPQATCAAQSGFTWSDSSDCAIDQCSKGCCVIGDQAFFVTEVKCKSVGSAYAEAAVSFDKTVATESACLDSVKNLDFGCCVSADNSAVFETRGECSSAATTVGVNFTIEGFHEGMLCSNDLLSSGCAKQKYTGCYQGKVYWYDSCGNRENIYSSDTRASYNSGYTLSDTASCTTSGAYDPNCGNCDYSLGETCGADDKGVMNTGDYTCVDLNCDSTYQNDASPQSGSSKKNGESWCIYDQKVGEGLDTVGSRHYRHLCVNGEEITEPCADYREQVCVGGILGADVLSNYDALHMGGGDYVEAACRDNRADTCSACNDATLSLTDQHDCCTQEDTQDCYWLPTGTGVAAGETYEDGRCVPQVPKGLKFWSDSGSGTDAASGATCNVASATCTVTYRIGGFSRLFGGSDKPNDWEIISEDPDNCATKDWLVDQNTYCRSLGDCGAYYNFVGEPGYEGFSSTMFDESFFNEVKDITPLDTTDLGDWESLKSTNNVDESHKFFSTSSPYFYENPVFYIGIVTAAVGGISNIGKNAPCMASVTAAKAAAAFDALKGTATAGLACVTTAAKADGSNKCGTGLTCVSGLCTAPAATTTAAKCKTDSDCTNGETCDVASGQCQSQREKSCTDLGYTNGGAGDTSNYYKCSDTSYTVCQETAGVGSESSQTYSTASYGSFPVLNCGTTEGYGDNEKLAQDTSSSNKIDTCGKSTATTGMSCTCTSTTQAGFTVETGYCNSAANSALYCCKSSVGAPALAPSVSQFGPANPLSTVGTATTAISGAKSLTAATDTLGCFIGGALPIPTSWLGGAAKGGLTRAMNYFTLIAGVYLAVEYGHQNETTITYTANCNMWQPPSGGTNCEKCNNENTPCSEYRCHSLGASCALINQGTDNETCISQYANDVNSPQIRPLTDSLDIDGYTITETTSEGDKGYVINEPIPPFTPLTVGVSTDEPSECKYSTTVGTDYASMTDDFGSTIYAYNHTGTFSLGSDAASPDVFAASAGQYTLYLRCTDANGNANERDYFIRFTVDTTPDLTPPQIEYTSITDGSYMPYNATETSFSLYTNEPASCRWNANDTDYSLMAHDMSCASSSFDQNSQYYGTYQCDTTLTGVSTSELNYFYFKCKDLSGNANEESYKFTLKQTQSPLEITDVSPNETVYDYTVPLSLKTSGGAEDGRAICGFSTTDVNYFSMVSFFTTNGTSHSQDLTLPEGDYTYYFACQDIAGNQVYNKTSFTVAVDTSAPTIHSLYVDTIYSVLSLTMDENSACEYAPEDFTYGEGSSMTGVNTTDVHEANLGNGQLAYFVKCRDLYNNEGSYYVDLSTWV